MSGFIDSVKHASDFIHRSLTPLDTDGAADSSGYVSSAITGTQDAARAMRVLGVRDLPAVFDAIKNLNGVGIDDREFLLEKLVALMSTLPEDSSVAKKMQQFFIDTLYKDLPHPPTSFLGPTDVNPPSTENNPVKPGYAFRTDDGSMYNPEFPNLGRAGQPYARTVPSLRLTPHTALPDPGLVFDLLLKRDPKKPFTPHPGGLSSMFFGLANLVIHSVFDTDHSDWRINNASSYMDLSPLYGGGKGVQTRPVSDLRRLDGTGRLWDDVFADSRLLFMPPTTGVILILLNRNHNYIAEKILAINERGTYTNPPPEDEKKRRAQDDEIFHRARLVNSGFFAKIVLHDYVGGILGLTRDASAWRLNLTQTFRKSDHEFARTGGGGAVSAEFNMLYRWHATTSEPDAKWIDKVFTGMFKGKPFDQVTVQDFKMGARGLMRPDPDVRKQTIFGLKRNANGRYDDNELAQVLLNAMDSPAHNFGARSTPEALRVVDIMSMEQARAWGCCSLNEFRRFFGLRPYANFKEWNSDPEIADTAQALYRDIENLELHVGLQAEDAKPAMPGAGLCPGYTVSRAILADAVVLTRSDPFLTTECNPFNLTSWGFNYVTPDPNDGSFGGMLTKLLIQQLPNQFKPGNSYTHFPLYSPKSMQANLRKIDEKLADKYTWARPDSVDSLWSRGFAGDTYMQHMAMLLKDVKVDRSLADEILFSDANLEKWAGVFARLTDVLIRERSVHNPSGKTLHVDIAMDVINIVPIRFLAEEIVGLPLKTETNPYGVYRDEQLYEMFTSIANYLLSNYEPGDEWALRERATKYTQLILGEIEDNLARLDHGIFSVRGIVDSVKSYFTAADDKSDDFLRAVLERGKKLGYSHREIAASLFAEVAATAAPWSAMIASAIDYELGGTSGGTSAKFEKTADLGSDGLVNPTFLERTARAVTSRIMTLRNIRKTPGPIGQFDSFAQSFGGDNQKFFIDNVGRVTAFPARLGLVYDA